MFKSITILFATILLSCNVNTYYIVRHAEKEQGTTMTASTTKTTDVPLSAVGEKRAISLRDKLIGKDIRHIFSTNTIRTTSTAKPLSTASAKDIRFYNTTDSSFINQLKTIKGNVLVVGHSNTIDDIINNLVGEKKLSDLPDSAYGDLFVIKGKGKNFHLKTVQKF